MSNVLAMYYWKGLYVDSDNYFYGERRLEKALCISFFIFLQLKKGRVGDVWQHILPVNYLFELQCCNRKKKPIQDGTFDFI